MWTEEERKKFIDARIATASRKQLKTIENQAMRQDDPIRTYMLDKIAEKRKEYEDL